MATYAVLGAGALGGLYGGLLANSGLQVHFLVRGDYDHMRTQGLRVETPLGDFNLPSPSVFAAAGDMPQVDVVIVAWKATSNSALKAVLEKLCHSETIVLVLQNGLNVERDAAAVVGADRVLGGCCFLCSNKIGPGHIKHLDFGRIVFGEFGPKFSGKITNRMDAIVADFQKAGINIQPAADLNTVRWNKLAWNIPFNGLSVVLNSDTSRIMDCEASSQLVEAIMLEVQQAAGRCGAVVEDSQIQKMLTDTKKMVPYDSSMLLDYRAKRPMEVEAIFGNPLRAAQAAGYTAPKIQMLYQQLSFIEAANQNT